MSALTEWAHNSPPDDFWMAATVLVVLAVTGFIGAFFFFSRKRIMENTPTSRIRSAAQGYIELTGHGELLEGPPIIAPLTGRTCTWYQFSIEERRRSGKNSHWVNIENGCSDELFLFIDDTGQCIVDPEGATVTPAESNTWYGHSKRPASGPKSSSGFFSFSSGMGKYRYTEKLMYPKGPLYVIGLFKTVGGAGGEFDTKTDVRQLLNEWKQNTDALMKIYDKNKDGEIDMQEWEAVRERALDVVMNKHSEMKTAQPVNMLSRTNDSRRPYLLSAILQETLIKRMAWYSGSLISLFFIAGVIATWLINLRLQA